MVQIIRAQHLGFCFGVRDALAAAEEVPSPETTSVYGELVHNERVTASLVNRGFEVVRETDRETLPDRNGVLITAHGISETRRAKLSAAGHQLIDTTCPLVKRVHDAAQGLASRGFFVIVIGKPKHVEVQGIVEDLPAGGYAVVDSPDAVTRYATDRIGVVCQTTMPEDLAERTRDRIAERNPEASLRWINTVCRPTRQRQSAVDQLCDKVSVVVVVGGANSNNTVRLAERCRTNGVEAFHVQSAGELPLKELARHDRIGLTAGTSTPDETIDDVEETLKQIARGFEAQRVPEPHQTCEQWAGHFERSLANAPTIPWSDTPTLSTSERQAVIQSIQTFQLGESGEGKHLLRCAREWVHRGGDKYYVLALERFIQEENRHASWLASFLAQEQQPLLTRQWSDSGFRFLRHLAGLRLSISVLVTAEVLAQVYYLALLRATDSPALRAVCRRILRDERFHVVFQHEQMNRLSEGWTRAKRWTSGLCESVLFGIAKRIVWRDHRRVFLAAGMNRSDFHKRANRRWKAARRPR